MESFKIFFERRARNPIRKKELEGTLTNKEWIEQEKQNLPKKEEEKLQRMKQYKVEPERIEAFRQGKIKEHEKNLKDTYLRTKLEKPILLFNIRGIKVFKDKYVTEDFSEDSLHMRTLTNIVNKLLINYKDIVPNRKPKIVITNTDDNPKTKGVNILGTGLSPKGMYSDGFIYLDQFSADDFDVLLHEYAHYLAFRIPKQIRPMLKQEYRKMLVEVLGKQTRKPNLEGEKNEELRNMVAKKMGLPTEYAATNFDEWFAELISHWKNMANNRNTYRFKKILKKVLNRV